MPTINLQGFTGSNRYEKPRLLAESAGVDVVDAAPGFNDLHPLNQPLTVGTVPTGTQRQTIAGMGRLGDGTPEFWFSWPEWVSVTSGFDGSDTTERLYFSGAGTPKWTNNVIGLAGGPPYPQASRELAVPAPTVACTVVVDTEGEGTESDRFYVHTFVNDLGWESAPSPVSDALNCKDGAIVDITNLPAAPAGNYGITARRIYRTQNGTDSSAEFLFLREIPIGTTETVDDARALGEVMATSNWLPPPDGAFGLIALWNSMFAMVSAKTVHFCEPGSPYAWPYDYDIGLKDEAVATAMWESNLLVLTKGKPVLIQGQDPSGMADRALALSQPCASARSVAMFGHGAAWASKRGAAYAGTNGQMILTEYLLTQKQWKALNPATMIGGRWRGLYVVSYEVDGGRKAFMIDPLKPLGVWWLSFGFDACWYDEEGDDFYILQGGNVRRFDGSEVLLTARFTSKVFRQVIPMNYGWGKVVADGYPITLKVWSDQIDPETKVSSMVQRATVEVPGPETFALPSGFVSEDWQFEVVSQYSIDGVRITTNPELLKGGLMATGKKGRRDLPAVSQSLDPKVREPLERLTQELRQLLGFSGDGQDQAITKRTAKDLGLQDLLEGGGVDERELDLTPPPQVAGLSAVAGLTTVLVEWDAPIYPQGGGHGQTNIYAVRLAGDSPLNPTFGDAVRMYDATGALTIAALPSELNERWHIWAKWQTADGVESVDPAGGVHGIAVTTGKIGNAQIAPLAIQAAQLAEGAVDLTTGKVKADSAFGAIAVGYTVTQYLIAMSGYMANLVVSNAQIASLSASKLTVGDGTVGGNLKSTIYTGGAAGWLLMPSGYFEANDAVIRGTVFATAGEFSAVVRMGAASSYGAGVGLWQGYDSVNYVWRVGDPAGNRAQWDGSQFSIYIAGQAQPIMAAGGISAGTGTLVINTPGLTLNSSGDAVFAGMLAAATGTFAGTLSAGTVTPAAFEAIVSEFANAGTFSLTVPAKRDGWAGLAARITLQGAGGGGGGAYGTGAPNSNPIASGAGGGAGQRTVIVLESVTTGEVLNLVVGARGPGGGASQANAGGASAGNGTNGGNTTVTRAGVTYSATGGTGGKGGWRNSDSNHNNGFAVVPAGSLGGQQGYGRNSYTGQVYDGENWYYTTNGAMGGYGGSSQYGAGGAAGAFAYRWAGNGGDGGRGAGGGGGGVDCQHPDVAYTGNGGPGGIGYILVEFYDPYSVVTNKRYGPLIEWLDTRGFGSVPTAAR